MSARFWLKVDKDGPLPRWAPFLGPCWLWTAGINQYGYGNFHQHSRTLSAHRFAYEDRNGPIPAGLQLDHLCRVRSCVNPDHLEAVTLAENIRRGQTGRRNEIKTHCKNGHEFTPENTYLYGPDREWRMCKTCSRARKREAQAA